MMRFKRKIAALLVAVIVYSIMGSSLIGAFAAEMPVDITVDKFENGTLTISWNNISGARAAVIAYHKPDVDDKAVLVVSDPVLTGNSASIAGLEADYIYDICVVIYGAVDGSGNPTGSPIGRGLLFYLPSITFTSTAPSQPYEEIAGGGREIGVKPKLKLNWRQPKVFNDPDGKVYPETDSNQDNNTFLQIDAFNSSNYDSALEYMETALNKVYGDAREISTLNYRVNLSTRLNYLNAGSDQASLLVEKKAGNGFDAMVSGTESVKANVQAPNASGFISFELLGKADEDAENPAFDPSKDYVLPNGELLPGTVYYMNIKPVFRNDEGTEVNGVFVGNPGDQNGSMLSGSRPYVSTPIRFQITKDSANNIYIRIFKINQGSLNLPRLYYEVQATDTPSLPGDWAVKKTMDDSYFSGNSAITVITGVNPNNEIYYKIVVKSESPDDRLESLPLPYKLTIDTSRPPLPTGIKVVDRVLNIGDVELPDELKTPDRDHIEVKSTDITFSWDKPLNWNDVKDDLYFHFLLNTNQSEIDQDVPVYVNGMYWDSYPAKYRLVKYVSAKSPDIKEVGNRLTYTMKAFDLFSWEDDDGNKTEIPNSEEYPSFLIPNTVYYLQMYTTSEANRGSTDPGAMSDKSIVISFTTLNGIELDVPLPSDFQLVENGKDTSFNPPVNYIDLSFDKVTNIDWNNYISEQGNENYEYETYYDIYINTRTDTEFTLLGTTEEPDGDVLFTGADDPQSTSIRARISQFKAPEAGDPPSDIYTLLGGKLLPNTTYYFKVRTRLVLRDKSAGNAVVMSRESIDTAILPVTTIVIGITPPDDNARKPLAPTDFRIAEDAGKNRLLSGDSVTFTWQVKETDVIYELIRTSHKVGTMDGLDSYRDDPEYLSFIQEYDVLSDGEDDNKVYLDPLNITHTGKFTYDPATKTCTYTVDRRMFPNKLYYFSIKAVRTDSNRDVLVPKSESVWVSIPVTTSLIEAPTSLEVVVKGELGIYWTDSTPGLTADDYRIYVKGESDADYKLMTRSNASIVKDSDGRTYFGRISGLTLNSYYDVKVVKGSNTVVYSKTGLKTRDGYHEIEVRWVGKHLDDYSRYDIAIMAEGEKEYTVLSSLDLEQYINSDGSILPYYTQETLSTINSDKLYYYAKIKSTLVTLPGGIVTRQPLRSNVKYYIKVRTVKIDPVQTDLISYSKYIGPVNTRTEFSQDDYDNTDREEQQKAVFLDKMKELEKGYYWRVSVGSSANIILLKGERVADALLNTSIDTFTVDMTEIAVNLKRDEIYVPVSVIRAMNQKNKNLLIRTSGSELLLRPSTINASANKWLKEISDRQGVKDIYVKVAVSRSTAASPALTQGAQRATEINELNIQAMGISKSDSELKTLFHNKLYDEESGLVSQKLNMLLNTYTGSGPASDQLIDKYTGTLIEMIEKELSVYIDSTIVSVKLSNTIRNIDEFETPASVKMTFSATNGVKTPYVIYPGDSSWRKISTTDADNNTAVRFNLSQTGKYVVLVSQSSMADVPASHWAYEYIRKLTSKYDLSDVFPGINSGFMPENTATCKEVVLLYEKVIGKSTENAGLDIKQKNIRLGLNGIINANSLPKSVKRQETAAVLIKLFAAKKGVSESALRPNGRVDIADEGSVGKGYFNQVLLIVDMNVMELTFDGKFNPNNNMTRAEVVSAFVKLLEKTGDL